MTTADAKEQRRELIDNELGPILEKARDFCFQHYEDDMDEQAVQAVQTAAAALAYRKRYFDVIKDEVVYFPSCRKLILSRGLVDEAEKHYNDEGDEFPAEYAKALRSVAFAQKDGGEEGPKGEGGDVDVDDEEFMANLAMEWTEAL